MFIPQEIVIDIFSRLPVKSISRFKSASKQWYSFFNDPIFVDLHRKRALDSRHMALLLYGKMIGHHKYISFHYLDIDAAKNRCTANLMLTKSTGWDLYKMQTPCNGLICFYGWDKHIIYVCNPRTQEFTILPKASSLLVTDWCKTVGFGFDISTNKYKVLRMFRDADLDDRYGCEVFTLGSVDGKWKWVGYTSYPIRHYNTASVNGATHWLIEPSLCSGSSETIISFNFQDEKFRVVPLPKCSSWRCREELYLNNWNLRYDLELRVLRGCLCIVDKMDRLRLDIWMLKDYDNVVWVKEYSIDATQLPSYMKPYRHIFPVDVWDGKVLLSAGQRFYSYDPERKTGEEFKCEVSGQYEAYVETLVSFGGTRCIDVL